MSATNENVSPDVVKRVAKEIVKLAANAPEGIKIHINDENITDVQATITGPEGTPYEGGRFRVKLVLGGSFPSAPPKGYFVTKIFHPNVSKSGDICVNTLKKDWKPEMGIAHVLTVVKCLLIYPNPASALNEEAGKLLLEQYDDFARHAKMMTEIHARPKTSDTTDADGSDKSKRAGDGSGPLAKKTKAKLVAGKKKADKRALKRL